MIEITLEYYPISNRYYVMLTEAKTYLCKKPTTGFIKIVAHLEDADYFSSERTAINFANEFREQKGIIPVIRKPI